MKITIAPDPLGRLTMVFLAVKLGEDYLFVPRPPYVGLPEYELKQEEDIDNIARKTLTRLMSFMTLPYSDAECISEFVTKWGKFQVPALCKIFSYPAYIHNLFSQTTILASLDRIQEYDIDPSVRKLISPSVLAAA